LGFALNVIRDAFRALSFVPSALHGSAAAFGVSIKVEDGSQTDGACIAVRDKVYRNKA
jgi:hypothetical protein